MATIAQTQKSTAMEWKPKYALATGELKWSLAFLGVLSYLFVEYTRLPAMFPFLMPFQLGKVAVGLGLFGMLFATGKRAVSPATRSLDTALIVFTFAMLLAMLFAEFPKAAFLGFFFEVQWVIVYFLVSRTLNSRWRIVAFFSFYFLLNAKLAQFSIRMYFAGMAHFNDAAAMAKFGSGAGSTGFFANAGDFGVAMATIFPLCAYLVFAKMKKTRNKLLVLACSGLFFLAVVFCGSRGALVGACAAITFDCVRNPKRIAAPILLVVFLVGSFFILPEANKARLLMALTPSKDGTSHDRLVLWGVGMKMLRDHPILGVGPDNFQPVFDRDYPESLNSPATVPHSIYVQSLSELGMVGTLPLLGFMFLIFRVNASTRKRLLADVPIELRKPAQRTLEYCLSLGLDLGLVGYLVSGAFITVLFYPHLWLLAAMSVGLNTAVHHGPLPQIDAGDKEPRLARPRFAS